MSRKKKISNYYKEQEKLRKKQKNEQFYSKLMNVLIVVLSITLVVTVLYLFLKPAPFDPIVDGEKVTVVMKIKDMGAITLELYADLAPKTVENFLKYVNEDFYDGLTFHRVIENFMIQGGDPTGTGQGLASLPTIKGEFESNGFTNNLAFDRGIIGMARAKHPDSASTQFFICHQKSYHLNGEYAAFGRVIDGMDVVDMIATCEKDPEIVDDKGNKYAPLEKVIIERIYVVD